MKIGSFTPRHLAFLAVGAAGLLAGCEDKGPMQKAGEKVDKAADALDPRGPAEKLGDKVDQATGK